MSSPVPQGVCPRCQSPYFGPLDYCPVCAAPVSAREIAVQADDLRSCATFVCLCFGILLVCTGLSLVYLGTRHEIPSGFDPTALVLPGELITAVGCLFFAGLAYVLRLAAKAGPVPLAASRADQVASVALPDSLSEVSSRDDNPGNPEV